MFKTYLAVAIVVLSSVNVCMSFTEKRDPFLCHFNATKDVRCYNPSFQTISSVTYAFRGCAAGCPSRDAECTASTHCWKENLTSQARECLDKLSCEVNPPQKSLCSNEAGRFLNVSYNCSNLAGYMGCFKLEDARNVTIHLVESSASMTVQRCLALCRDHTLNNVNKKFLMAGLENGTICRCGSEFKTIQSVSTSQCNVNCTGDTSQRCGGVNHVDIYSTSVGQCDTGGTGRIRENYGVIYSPGFPDKYPNLDKQCTWIVSVQEGKVIKVTLYLLNLGRGDSLHLRDGSDGAARLLTAPLTGSKIPPHINASSSNNIWIRLIQSNSTSRGRFILEHTAIGHCGKIDVRWGEVSPDHNGNFGIGEIARIDCVNESLSLVVECLGRREFNVTPPYCNDITPTSTVRPTATPSVESSSPQLAVTSMATTRDVSQQITIVTGKGNNSIIIPIGRSTDPNGKTTTDRYLLGDVGQTEAPPGGRTLPVTIGVAVGINVLVLTAIIVAVVIVMKRRRTPAPVPPTTSPPKVTADVTTDVTPEPVYDTVREEEEGGVQLALSGATCSYSTIGQPNVTSDSDGQAPVYSKPDKKKAKTPPNVEDLYTKPVKKESGEVENVLYESAGDFSGASPSQEGGTDNVLYASADEI